MSHIKPGSLIKGPLWPEAVEVKFVEEMGEYLHIVGATSISGNHIDQIISREELGKIGISQAESFFTQDPWKVFLALEARRYRFASMYDPLLAMNTSKVDPLPHQIEAVYGYVLQLPRIRFLIADDPGAGKTIMAGLIIKELKLRNLVRRVLIICPGHIKDQWRRELADRFEERFIVIDRGLLDAFYGENAWLRENQIITSIDFAKREEVLASLTSAHFDLVIVDEAHKMSAYRYGEKTEKTIRYRLGEAISAVTEHLLFLTATPHKGDPDNFRLFLDLLVPGFFATNEMLQESIDNKDNPLFIRRIKEDLKDFQGRPLFLPRHVKTVPFNLGADSPAEKDLYNELSRYVNTQYNKALTKDKKRNITFALIILQRRLASSTYALLKSLERRKRRLEELLEGAIDPKKPSENSVDFDTVEDLSEEERWQQEEIWETLSVAENREELEREIATLTGLIDRARAIIKGQEEIKLKELRLALNDFSLEYKRPEDRKFLVFTESRDTLDYLENRIKEWGFKTNTIHGGMRLEDRIRAEGVFKTESEVLVATEAAGEGINLQFCHLMVNYDIPWNPNRLEQRMGRIHRYGQTKEVFVFNLVAEDTREGRVLTKLFEKLREIRNTLGSDKVFDVLSEILYDRNLSQLMMEAAANARSIDEILKEIDIQVDADYVARVKENLGDSLATRYIDYTRIQEMATQAEEQRLIPEYTESFFKKAFLRAGGKFRERKDGFLAIDAIPFDIRRTADQDLFKKRYGDLLRKYPKVAFDKEKAFRTADSVFVSFGHPLFEAVMAWVEATLTDALVQGARFVDPDGRLNGYILFYEGEIRDGTGDVAGKRLFAFYVDPARVIPMAPSVIWDLAEDASPKGDGVDVEGLKQQVSRAVIARLEEYRGEILKERLRQGAIKEKYGVKSLDYLIVELDGDLIRLYERKDMGDNVDLVIRNKEDRKNKYAAALEDLTNRIEKEKGLTMSMPRFVGIIRVTPGDISQGEMAESAEIEQIGMETAMAYEVRNGRTPQDVSAENLGFDIRSVNEENQEIRYIEVKARAGTGPVALTQNEWFKAQRFKDAYYLYAVMNAATLPQLYMVRDPAENLAPEEKVEVVRYVVGAEEIKDKGDRAP